MQWVCSLTATTLPAQDGRGQVTVHAETEQEAKLRASINLGVAPSAIRAEKVDAQERSPLGLS